MELALESQKENIGLHFYYSLLDWGRPDYGFGKKIVDGAPEGTDWDSYIRFMKTQLTELITKYPNVKAIWFDGNWERPDVNWHYGEIYGLIHQLNASILVGNNHHITPMPGEDFQTFEKDLPGENKTGYRKNNTIASLPLETCETINNSWGFNINDRNYKTSRQLIRMMVGAAGRNANFLLNVGPMPDGRIQQEFADTLRKLGRWLQEYGVTIYETRGGIVSPQEWGVVTAKGKTLFVHLLHPSTEDFVFIPSLKSKVVSAVTFDGKKPLRFRQEAEGVFVYINGLEFQDLDTILQLQLQ
jgi:alpha-L-fucosidase